MTAKKQKKPMSNKKFLAIWLPIIGVAAVLLLVANIALNMGGGWVESQLGAGTYTVHNTEEADSWDKEYYKSDFEDEDAVEEAARVLVEEIAAEGMVLAKDENGALPLASGAKITMMGRSAADPIYGGSGSGSIDVTTGIDARQGLENAGFQVNETVIDKISEFAGANPRGFIEMDKPNESTYNIGELPVTEYEAVASSFAEYNDAAVVFIGRPGGEGGDLTRDMDGWDDNYVEGQHQLTINQDELDMIDLAVANFDKVIVVVNASTSLEMGPIQENPGVDGVFLIGSPGLTGFNGLGSLLAGEVNPSGRTVDVWAAKFADDPTFVNFGDFKYNNVDVSYPTKRIESLASNAEVTSDAPFVNYQEGIYYGYRYYETADAEGFINYDEAVVYPFGYGLSYTNFEWGLEDADLGPVDGEISVDVKVTNTGDKPGKDVVELYYTAPYTKGGIEKAEVVLAGFAKTDVIEPGASETVTIDMLVEEMASYDHKDHKAYVLEEGEYVLTLRTDSHTVSPTIDPIDFVVEETIVYDGDKHRATDATEVTNQFDDVSIQFTESDEAGKIKEMSRADFKNTFPTAPTEDMLVATDEIAEGFAPWDADAAADEYEGEAPVTGADTDLTLIDLRGADFDDERWDELLDSLTIEEMTEVLLNGAYQTAAIPSIAKPNTTEPDGPAGFSSFINADINGVAYPSEYLIAQTWNVELGLEMGEMLGNEALFKGINGWYAPAVNLHRSPFGGRNFEYYSEDPFLSGEMLTAVANGAAEKGVYAFMKHYAMNEQETNRVNNGPATWATEQTIREIYLKPFEKAVKEVTMEVPYIVDENGTVDTSEVGATALMGSFNRIGATWTGGSTPLMNNVLRDEWGFEGFTITDFNLYPYMNPNEGLNAGTDLTLTFAPSKSFDDVKSAKAQQDIRTSTHRILYTVANSNAMNGMAPGTTVTYTPPAWKNIQNWTTVGISALLVVGLGLVIRRVAKHKDDAKKA